MRWRFMWPGVIEDWRVVVASGRDQRWERGAYESAELGDYVVAEACAGGELWLAIVTGRPYNLDEVHLRLVDRILE